MVQTSFPWTGTTTGDAGAYDADFFAEIQYYLNRANLSNNQGVLLESGDGTNNPLEVVENSVPDLNVRVHVGRAIVQGRYYDNDAVITLSVTANTNGSGWDRIDTVALEVDYAAQTVRAVVVQGTAAASPVPPTLTKTNDVLWQVPVAYMDVRNLASSVVDADITNAPVGVGSGHVGEVRQFAMSTLPYGWVFCNGNALSRTYYKRLFDVISTAWGTGDGSTTFNIPDLRGLFLKSTGVNGSVTTTNEALAVTGGEEDHTLTIGEMPSHAHSIRTDDGNGGGGTRRIGVSDFSSGFDTDTTSIVANGGGGGHNNMPPYGVVKFGIRAF